VPTHVSDGKEGPTEVRVQSNAMFSYGLIQSTVIELQSRPTWKDDKKVKSLKLGDGWVRNFLRHNCFTRHRISMVIKQIPSGNKDIQEVQKKYNIVVYWVVNLDETGIFYGAAPKHIFELNGARNCEIPDHDEKSRFTVEFTDPGDCNILRYFIVIKCSAPSGSNPHDFGNM
jgi:hypothetical protein